jgi:hypothetical protein
VNSRRPEIRRHGAVLTAALLALAPAAASAQSPTPIAPGYGTGAQPPGGVYAPVPAVPGSQPSIGTPPVDMQPVEAAPLEGIGEPPGAAAPGAPYTASPAPSPNDAGRSPTGIEVGRLGAVDPGAVGTLDPASGGFGLDLWRGLDRPGLERLLTALPAPSGSRVGRDLSRRLLLSPADVPAGAPDARNLVALRADKLLAAGRAADASALVGQVGASARHASGLDALGADAQFLAGNNERACASVDAAVAQGASADVLKAIAFCRALIGDGEGASLAVDMMREDKVEDPAFAALLATLLGGPAPKLDARAWERPTPLRIAMARAAKVPLPESLYADPSPRLVPALLASDGPAAGRLEAARRAEALGIIDAPALGQVYEAATFTNEEAAGGVEAAKAMSGARQAARLYQIARAAPDPEAAGDALRLALSSARADGTFGTAARLNAPFVRALTPLPTQAATAPLAIRSLLAAGDLDGALAWYRMLRDAAPGNSDVAFLVLDLWPLMQVADGGRHLPWGIESPARWLRGQAAAGDRFRRAAVAYTLFEWRGWPVNDAAWEPVRTGLVDPGRAAPPDLVAEMRAAAERGEAGHALLALLGVIGDAPPDRMAVGDIKAVLGTLDRLGLKAEAEAFAREAALGAGL